MKQKLKRLWFRLFSDHPLTYPGRALVRLMPRRVLARYQSDFFTGQQSESLVGRMIRSELNRQYYSKSESEQRRLNRERFWGGQAGAEWHEKQRERLTASGLSEDFLKFRRPLVQQIRELLAAAPRYTMLCEIGTGNGLFLQHLSHELSGIKRFVGLDLNREQIARNRQTYAGSKLEFVAGEVEEWIRTNATVPTIFVAVGTLECFTEAELADLLRKIHATPSGAAVGLCEPINIDLGNSTASAPRGNTMYSHNYPHLLRSSGYALFRQHVEPIDPAVRFYEMVVMVATTAPVAAPQESFA